jgi:hypothetical protein
MLASFSFGAARAAAAVGGAETSDAPEEFRLLPGGISLSGAENGSEMSFVPGSVVETGARAQASGAEKEKKRGEWLIAPVPSYSPTMGWTVGLPVARLYRPAGVADDDPTWVTGIGGFYAENKSWGAGAFHKMSLPGDRWRFMAAAGYADINYNYYGIGGSLNDRGDVLPLNQTAFCGAGEVLREVARNLYVGVRVTAMGTTVRATGLPDTIPPESIPSALGINLKLPAIAPRLQYDTRDSEFYPTSGDLIEAEVQISSESLGSDLNYRIFDFSWNHYRSVGASGVLALRLAGKYAAGDAPFFVYPSFGQKADLRGYTPGTYRDRMLLAAQAEYRLRVRDNLGVVVFAGLGGVAPSLSEFDRALPSVGAGLRYVLAKENNLSLRLDVAWGRDEHQIYIGIGEAF